MPEEICLSQIDRESSLGTVNDMIDPTPAATGKAAASGPGRRRLAVWLAMVVVAVAGLATALALTPTGHSNMTIAQAAVLGLVEGLTEYLPISSTGHLILAQRAMGLGELHKEAADAYAICIQAGAILAVLGLYVKRVKQMAWGVLGRDTVGRHLAVNVAMAFLPAAVAGLLLNELIKEHLFGLWPTVYAWFVGGVAILAVAWRRNRRGRGPERYAGMGLDELTWRLALVIGLAQCIAMWPGVSRSLVTIVGGVLVGLSLPAAVEFSFLLGVLTLGAATVYDGLKHGSVMLETYSWSSLIVGFVVAMLSAVIAVKWMVAYLNRHGLSIFGYYRVALGLMVAMLILMGILEN